MARRIILGRNGGPYQFKVSAAGYDAATAPLDGLLFDADNVPARVAAQGTFRAERGNYLGVETARSHGVSSPSMCIAIARPWNPVTSSVGDWYVWFRLASGTASAGKLDRPLMDKNYCTPFYWWADQGNGTTEFCGWKFRWTSSQVICESFTYEQLDVRWAALEF
ncbi:hypothetical protein [Microvirga lenta]|uniref:hypothetical protein n=1 Tax=Microvirga lenta TaxID=2881337 RepID=UPI001CFD5D88|nr:hypothetical protein [Microvirga lenta]MCB5173636.1 hypothetical protein [Microvirga lenta]